MPASIDRPIHAAMISWVIALVALVGLNAIAPDYLRVRKNGSLGEAGISQPLDVPPVPGHISSPLVFLISHNTCRAAMRVSRLLCVEVIRDEPPFAYPQGAVRGRAPPAGFVG